MILVNLKIFHLNLDILLILTIFDIDLVLHFFALVNLRIQNNVCSPESVNLQLLKKYLNSEKKHLFGILDN
jgi:hypothetical protein